MAVPPTHLGPSKGTFESAASKKLVRNNRRGQRKRDHSPPSPKKGSYVLPHILIRLKLIKHGEGGPGRGGPTRERGENTCVGGQGK